MFVLFYINFTFVLFAGVGKCKGPTKLIEVTVTEIIADSLTFEFTVKNMQSKPVIEFWLGESVIENLKQERDEFFIPGEKDVDSPEGWKMGMMFQDWAGDDGYSGWGIRHKR